MRRLIGVFMGVIAVVGFSSVVFAVEGRTDTGMPIKPAKVKGEVTKADGDTFTIKDKMSGKEVKLNVEKDIKAKLDRPLKVGDQIEADLTPEGYAKEIRFAGQDTKGGSQDRKDMQDKRDSKSPPDIGTIQEPGTVEPQRAPKQGP
jgi:hypothetical protein